MILYFSNTKDFPDKIYQYGFIDKLIVDERHGLSYKFLGEQLEVDSEENNGSNYINQVFSFDEWEISFIINVNTARFLSRLKLLDSFYFLHNQEIITPDNWDSVIDDSIDFEQHLRKVIITYRINYVDKTQKDSNYLLDGVSINIAPIAKNVKLTYSTVFDVGREIVCIYTYFDADGDIEGNYTNEPNLSDRTWFGWYLADDNIGTNALLVKSGTLGEPTEPNKYTIVEVFADKSVKGMFLTCKVIPRARTGLQNVTQAYLPTPNWKMIKLNEAPTVESLSIAGLRKPGETVVLLYTYKDADNDLEGPTIIRWYSLSGALLQIRNRINSPTNYDKFTIPYSYQLSKIVYFIYPRAVTGNLYSSKSLASGDFDIDYT